MRRVMPPIPGNGMRPQGSPPEFPLWASILVIALVVLAVAGYVVLVVAMSAPRP